MNDPSTAGRLRALQVIVISLVLGTSVFAIIAAAMPPAAAAQSGQSVGVLQWIALGYSAAVVPGALLLRLGAIRLSAARQGSEDNGYDPMSAFFVMTIIGCAILEGAALFDVVYFLLSRDFIAMVAALVLCSLMVFVFYPTRTRFESFRRLIERGSGL